MGLWKGKNKTRKLIFSYQESLSKHFEIQDMTRNDSEQGSLDQKQDLKCCGPEGDI